MSRDFDERFPRFHIGQYDRVIIEGTAFTLVEPTDEAFILAPAEGGGLPQTFPFPHLNRLNAAGKVRHEPEHFLPAHKRRAAARRSGAFQVSLLSPEHKERLDIRYALVQAFHALYADGRVRRCEKSINAVKKLIAEVALPFLEQTVDLKLIDKEAKAAAGEGRGPMGGTVGAALTCVDGRTLLGWVRAEERHGKAGLADNLSRRGRRDSRYTPEETVLMASVVHKSWLNPNKPSKTQVVRDVLYAFQAENERRAQAGLPPLNIPGRKAVRARIASYGAFETDLARLGRDRAIQRNRPVGRGIEVSRPLERAEIDETKVDLITVMKSEGLAPLFSQEDLETLGLNDEDGRWWMTMAIDCRTRIVLGMTLTKAPKASSAKSCLRMIVSDKGEISDDTGAIARWTQYGSPELLVADNGSAFKAIEFTDACNDMGIPIERTFAGAPAMRGTIERMFRTCANGLLPRLDGRTFSSVIERGDHASGERACHDAESLCYSLVRWIVDIYHNSPHEGLGGRTPLRQWEMDHAAGNFPLCAAPDARAKRLAFGVPLRTVASKAGITVLGLRYHSEALARHVIDRGAGSVDIRWDSEDIGVIEVLIAGEWREVPAVHDGFVGTNVWTWTAARRALRTTTPKRKEWEEDVVRRAVEAIKAMNTERSLQFRLIDKPMDAKRVAAMEAQLFDGFVVTGTAPKTRVCDDGHGVSILARAPEEDGDAGPSSGNSDPGLPPDARPPRHDEPWRFDDEER